MANSTTSLPKSAWRAFIQPDGAGTKSYLMNCLQFGAITSPKGDVEPSFCQSPTVRDEFIIDYVTTGAAALPTTQIVSKMQSVPRFMDSLCPDTNFYILAAPCDTPSSFKLTAGGSLVQFPNAHITSDEIDGTVDDFEGGGDVLVTHDITGGSYIPPKLYPLDLSQVITLETEVANDVANVDSTCASGCSTKIKENEIYYIACSAVGAGTANVLVKYAGNTQPTAVSADPFVADRDISTILILPMGEDTVRVIVFQGTTDVAAPALSAYADIDIVADPTAAVWTNVTVGATNAEFFIGGNSAYSLPNGVIYAVTDAGKIHKSADSGATWVNIISPTANQLNVVKSHIENSNDVLIAGATNTIATSKNGGVTWSVITGPTSQAAQDVLSAHFFDGNCFWLGYDDGKAFYTKTGGKTWVESSFIKPAGFSTNDRVNDIYFTSILNGFAVGMSTDGGAAEFGSIWQTFDGGYSWSVENSGATFTAGVPTGFNSLAVGNNNHVITVGDPITITSIFSLAAAEPTS